MQEGRWTTRPCDWSRVAVLAEELGVSETTATVLVRRGLDENPGAPSSEAPVGLHSSLKELSDAASSGLDELAPGAGSALQSRRLARPQRGGESRLVVSVVQHLAG